MLVTIKLISDDNKRNYDFDKRAMMIESLSSLDELISMPPVQLMVKGELDVHSALTSVALDLDIKADDKDFIILEEIVLELDKVFKTHLYGILDAVGENFDKDPKIKSVRAVNDTLAISIGEKDETEEEV